MKKIAGTFAIMFGLLMVLNGGKGAHHHLWIASKNKESQKVKN